MTFSTAIFVPHFQSLLELTKMRLQKNGDLSTTLQKSHVRTYEIEDLTTIHKEIKKLMIEYLAFDFKMCNSFGNEENFTFFSFFLSLPSAEIHYHLITQSLMSRAILQQLCLCILMSVHQKRPKNVLRRNRLYWSMYLKTYATFTFLQKISRP